MVGFATGVKIDGGFRPCGAEFIYRQRHTVRIQRRYSCTYRRLPQLKSAFLCCSHQSRNPIKHSCRSFSKQNAIRGVTKAYGQGSENTKDINVEMLEEAFEVKEHTVDAKTSRGVLSPAAINAIEQFSRLNGLTGKRMRENFERYAPVAVQNEPRNLLEFCCFRYLARGSLDFNPSLKDAAFRRLTFVTMLAWQQPYAEDVKEADKNSLVKEAAFVRIAPAIPGAADRATAHHLFKALTGDGDGLSFDIWDSYLSELCSVVHAREEYRHECSINFSPEEYPVCIGANSRQPVQKWDKHIAWPGDLIMTNQALYFQPLGIMQQTKTLRLDITESNAKVEKKKVGPFGVELFDSAISVSSSSECDPWVLEFVDFSGKQRRDFWYSYIQEIIIMYNFVRDYAPKMNDPSLQYVYGAKNGRRRAVNNALLGIARLQAVQATLKKPPTHPEKLLQFSYVANAPGGDLVFQTLAVDFWGGRMELNSTDPNYIIDGDTRVENEASLSEHIVGTDGGVYLRKWMTSESWKTSESIAFWKQKLEGKGLVLGKNLVVGALSQTERAVQRLRERSRTVEETKATIDRAIITGIPENIDLLQELLFPLQAVGTELNRMKSWEEPGKTVIFLFSFYSALYMNWLRYMLPAFILASTLTIFTIRGLKASGHLDPSFGKVTIKERAPSNTIQKIISLKEALALVETNLQKANVALLKIRTVILYGNIKATNMVLLALIAASIFLLTVPYRVTLGLLVLDQFTMELEFRKPMVRELLSRLKAWWESIPAAPVVIQPYEKPEGCSTPLLPDNPVIKSDALADTLNHWFGDG